MHGNEALSIGWWISIYFIHFAIYRMGREFVLLECVRFIYSTHLTFYFDEMTTNLWNESLEFWKLKRTESNELGWVGDEYEYYVNNFIQKQKLHFTLFVWILNTPESRIFLWWQRSGYLYRREWGGLERNAHNNNNNKWISNYRRWSLTKPLVKYLSKSFGSTLVNRVEYVQRCAPAIEANVIFLRRNTSNSIAMMTLAGMYLCHWHCYVFSSSFPPALLNNITYSIITWNVT